MTLLLSESLITQLEALLQAQVPTKVAELNTRYGDSLLTAPLAASYFTSQKFIEMIPEFPACFVLPLGWKFVAYNAKNGPNIVVHRAQIWWVAIDADSEVVQKKLQRYALGTMEILQANHAAGGLTGGFQLGGGQAPECDLSAVAPRGTEYLADVKMDLAFTSSETFG